MSQPQEILGFQSFGSRMMFRCTPHQRRCRSCLTLNTWRADNFIHQQLHIRGQNHVEDYLVCMVGSRLLAGNFLQWSKPSLLWFLPPALFWAKPLVLAKILIDELLTKSHRAMATQICLATMRKTNPTFLTIHNTHPASLPS